MLPNLNSDKTNHQDTEEDKQSDDAATGPGVRGTTPLKRKQKANNTWDEQASSFEVHQFQLFPQCQRQDPIFFVGKAEKDDDEECRNSAKGPVNLLVNETT